MADEPTNVTKDEKSSGGTKTKEKDSPKVHLIHFVRDGFTAFGTVWYRGQEVEVTEGSRDWERTLDRNKNSWLNMTEEDQINRYGEVFFREGEWPYSTDFPDEKAREAEKKRSRRVPKAGPSTR